MMLQVQGGACLRHSGYAALLGGLCMAAMPARADTLANVTVGARGGYSSNPYQQAGSSNGAATGSVSIAPLVRMRFENGELRLGGTVDHTEYTDRYRGKTDYDGFVTLAKQIDARNDVNASFNYSNVIASASQLLLSPVAGNLDPLLPPVLDPDFLAGGRERRETFQGSVGLVHRFSEFDQISLTAGGTAVRLDGGSTLNEYNYGSAGISYSRRLSSRLAMGLGFSASKTDYLRQRLGDATTLSPTINAQLTLDGGWSLSASAGVTFVRSNLAVGTDNGTSASGSLTLCKKTSRLSACLTGSRAVLPSSLSGVGTQTSVGMNVNYALSEHSSISGSASYARSSRDNALGGTRVDDYIVVSSGYSRQFTRRLSGTVSLGYSDTFRSLFPRGANFYGTVGVRYTFGNII